MAWYYIESGRAHWVNGLTTNELGSRKFLCGIHAMPGDRRTRSPLYGDRCKTCQKATEK